MKHSISSQYFQKWALHLNIEFNIRLFSYYLAVEGMDEEQSMFYLEEFNDNQGDVINQNFTCQPATTQGNKKEALTLKAFNPHEYAENLPAKDQQKYLNMMMHNKTYPGLTHFINFDKTEQVPEFMSSFKGEDYASKDWIENPLHLEELFENENAETLKRKLISIEEEVSQINKRAFTEININHVIIPSFNEHFDNFRYLNSHINFLKDLEIKMIEFMGKAQDEDEGSELVVKIYQFWMKTFSEFVLSIKRHSERYTLSIAKKMKDSESNSNPEGKSTSSSRVMEAEKRRAWKASQLQILEKMINSNSAFNQASINKVAEELNRTPASVSSKIQKIIKDHKAHNPDYELHENMTLLEKLTNVMKNYPNGLSRQSVIERINEHYEMGYDMNWSKSVAQILSSRPEFVKIKGTYSLIGNHTFDITKKAFKDKVVNCLLSVPGGKACLKKLVDQYVSLYATTEGIAILSEERRKTIEASISKSLCRYDIFNKEKSKTIYKLRQFCDERDFEEEINNFIS